MALWMRLMVNDGAVGHLHAQRRPHRQPPQPDDVCFYDWRVSVGGTTKSNVREDPIAHRFGDGAWALVAKILRYAGHTSTELDDADATYTPLTVAEDTSTWPDEEIDAFAQAAMRRIRTQLALGAPDGLL